jgi:hypothetical protein
LTRSRSAVLLGEQVPRYQLVPSAPSSAGQEAIDLAASAGLILEPAQQLVLHGALGERRDGRWAASQVVVVKPRQNGKDAIAEAREIAGLYLFGEMLQTHTAHRYDTVQEHFRRVRELCKKLSDQTGDKRLKIKRISETNGDENIELMSGQRVLFKTRSKLGGRGPSPQVIFLNEAMYLADLGSLLPSLSAQDAPQVWWMGSAPLRRIESEPLRKLMRKCRAQAQAGRRRSGRVAYFEWSAHVDLGIQPDGSFRRLGDVDVGNRKYWAQANPGLGRRITVDWVETAELATMTTEEFAVERLGLYEDTEEVADPVIPPADWQACRSDESEIVKPVVYAFEVSMDRKWSVIAAAGRSSEHGTHVEIGENRQGTGWVVARLLELQQEHAPTVIVCNPSGPAGGLLPDCADAGLEVVKVTGTEFAQACQAAYDDVIEHRWRHAGQAALDKAVSGATKRTVGDAWVFDRRGDIDISPLVAVTLAAQRVDIPQEKKTPTVHAWADDDEEFNAILRQLEAEEDGEDGDDLDGP